MVFNRVERFTIETKILHFDFKFSNKYFNTCVVPMNREYKIVDKTDFLIYNKVNLIKRVVK